MKQEKRAQSRFPAEALLKSLLLLGFAAGFLAVYLTGGIRNYLNPRLDPFVLFAGLAFLLMAAVPLFHPPARRGKARFLPLLLFLLPVLLLLVRPAAAAAPESAGLSGTQIAGLPAPNQIKNDWGSFTLAGGTIELTDRNYMPVYDELDNHPEKYAGRRVECVGYVAKAGIGLPGDEFVAARDLMWCCAADLMTVGLPCRYAGAAGLPEKSWVRVTGTLAVTALGEKAAPLLTNVTVTGISKPAVPYLYPFR